MLWQSNYCYRRSDLGYIFHRIQARTVNFDNIFWESHYIPIARNLQISLIKGNTVVSQQFIEWLKPAILSSPPESRIESKFAFMVTKRKCHHSSVLPEWTTFVTSWLQTGTNELRTSAFHYRRHQRSHPKPRFPVPLCITTGSTQLSLGHQEEFNLSRAWPTYSHIHFFKNTPKSLLYTLWVY